KPVIETVEKEDEEAEKQEPMRSYLSKPANIYAEAKEEPVLPVSEVKAEEPSKDAFTVYEKPEVVQFESPAATLAAKENEQEEEQTIEALNNAFEEEEMQRRRQLERIQKLRSLSFNVNSNDPTDEFE